MPERRMESIHPFLRTVRARAKPIGSSCLRLAAALSIAVTLLAPGLTQPSPASAQSAPTSAADLRVALNNLGVEHVYLAGLTLSAALGGRDAELQVAANATDQNTQELGRAVGSVYGSNAEQQFLRIWRDHIGYFADYAAGAKAGDQAKKQKALQDLDRYRQELDNLLTGANPNLPKGAVAQLLQPHVQHIAGAIDALAAGDIAKGYAMLHEAAHQTQEIMDPLAAAIAKQFPDKFPAGAPAAAAAPAAAPPPAQPSRMPAQLPRTGEHIPLGLAALGTLGSALLIGGFALQRSARRKRLPES